MAFCDPPKFDWPPATKVRHTTSLMFVEALRSQKSRDPSYGAIIKAPTGRILLVLGRAAQKWSLPKGHANPGESPFECIVREIFEETGYTNLHTPVRSYTMRFGIYYEFAVDREFVPSPKDIDEIETAEWFTVEEALTLNLNSDTSAFIHSL